MIRASTAPDFRSNPFGDRGLVRLGAIAVSACWPLLVLATTGYGQTSAGPLAPLPAISQPFPRDAAVQGLPIESGPASPEGGWPDRPLAAPEGGYPGAAEIPRSRFFQLPEERYRGPGQPLIQESWQYRPLSIGPFFGFVQGGTLIPDWVREYQGPMGGIQIGWDYDPYWGLETRFGWAVMDLQDGWWAIAAQRAKDDANGLSPTDPLRARFDGVRINQVFLWDGHAMFYPWGDSAVRPYLMVGLGTSTNSFTDRIDVRYWNTLFTVPLGIGMKYRLNDSLALRMECADYIVPGDGSKFDMLQRLLITAGMEIRFGGARRAYWPWNPGRHYW
jgi:hypothetical protein